MESINVNEFMQTLVPTLGAVGYNFSLLVILIGSFYKLDLEKTKINVNLVYIVGFLWQFVTLLLLAVPTAVEINPIPSWIFLGMVITSLNGDSQTNPLAHTLDQLKRAMFAMKRDFFATTRSTINAIKAINKKFYPTEIIKKVEETF